jgi:integrase
MPRHREFTERHVAEAVAKAKLIAKPVNIHVFDVPRLYLWANPDGSTRYLYRYTVPAPYRGGRKQPVTTIHVGRPGISLNKAKEIAAQYADWLRDDRDPQEVMRWQPVEEATLGLVVDKWIEDQKPYQGESWLRNANLLLRVHCKPLLGLRVGAVFPQEIKKALAKVNRDSPLQADRAYSMLKQVLGYAKGMRYPMGDNPAREEIRRHVLPGRRPPREGHAWMHYTELPSFMPLVRQHHGSATAAVALEVLILTGGLRTSEVTKAEWSELDLEKAVWTIPAERMKKARLEHRVPLSNRVVELLRWLKKHSPEGRYVFTGYKTYQPMSGRNMYKFLTGTMNRPDVTVHGFRKSFRVWCAEKNNFDPMAVELCLSHTISDMALAIAAGSAAPEVQRAYLDTDLFEKRREIIKAWADFCDSR